MDQVQIKEEYVCDDSPESRNRFERGHLVKQCGAISLFDASTSFMMRNTIVLRHQT